MGGGILNCFAFSWSRFEGNSLFFALSSPARISKPSGWMIIRNKACSCYLIQHHTLVFALQASCFTCSHLLRQHDEIARLNH